LHHLIFSKNIQDTVLCITFRDLDASSTLDRFSEDPRVLAYFLDWKIISKRSPTCVYRMMTQCCISARQVFITQYIKFHQRRRNIRDMIKLE